MNPQPSIPCLPHQRSLSRVNQHPTYVAEELALVAAQRDDKGFDATEIYCSPEVVDQLCKKLLPRFRLPRLVRCGNRMFGLTYKFTVFKGPFSLHHAWLWNTKKIFSFKLDQRHVDVVKWDQEVRSKLLGVDTPRIIHAERQDKYCLTIMEPMAITMKFYMQLFLQKTRNIDLYYGMLMRTGIQCVRYLQRIHQNGYLHGNINPQTFIFPYMHAAPEGRPDLRRGPLIVDFSSALNWKQDPIYAEESLAKQRNNAIFPRDGGIYTRRDDMENFGYVLVFLAKGSLSWDTRTQRELVMYGKKCISDLHKYLKGIPMRIKDYLTYVRILRWNEEPDYDLLVDILSDKKMDIRKEIKIRRGRRQAEKVRQKRQKRTEEKLFGCNFADQNRETQGLCVNVGVPRRRSGAENLDRKKSRNNKFVSNQREDRPIPIRRNPTIETLPELPSEMSPNAVTNIEESNDGMEQQLTCSSYLREEQNPTLVQCLGLNTYSNTKYKEMLVCGRTDPFPSHHFECSASEHTCIAPVPDIASMPLRYREDSEQDLENMLIAETLSTQQVLPTRRLKFPRGPVRMSNPIGAPPFRYEITEGEMQRGVAYIPWETDRDQKHPWDEEMYNGMSNRRKALGGTKIVDVHFENRCAHIDPSENTKML